LIDEQKNFLAVTPAKNYIYLASRSPRRAELLKQIGVNFEPLLLREALSRQPDVAETRQANEAPMDYVHRIAQTKAGIGRTRLLQRRLADLPVLAADTAVTVGGRVFGKPENLVRAKEMLSVLSGKAHQVLTAVAVATENGTQVRTSVSTVRFRDISEREIQGYLSSGESHDKAGGYAIQGFAAVFIREISGSYSGVMGLPLFETAQLLEEAGITIFA
jgi:septum formation protein